MINIMYIQIEFITCQSNYSFLTISEYPMIYIYNLQVLEHIHLRYIMQIYLATVTSKNR